MNKKGQGAIIGMAIGAILLVVILSVIFSTLGEQTTVLAIVDDQFTSANGTCVRVTGAADCIAPGSTSSLVNQSEAEATGNFTECGTNGDIFGYDMNVAGALASLKGTAINATYTQRSCAFITNGTTRTLINLLPVLLALAILIFIVSFIALRR